MDSIDRNVFYPSIFEVSTENIRPSDLELLNNVVGPNGAWTKGPVYVFGLADDGFVIRTDGGRKSSMKDEASLAEFRVQKLAAMRGEGYSAEFVALIENAWENECVFLSIDRDNVWVPGFPAFDHETGEMVDDGKDLSGPSM